MKQPITVETVVKAPMARVWECWNKPEYIVKWAFASDDWEAPHAENDLRVGGKFKIVMAAKDKSERFDFTGVYTNVEEHECIEYTISDPPSHKASDGRGGRHVKVEFEDLPEGVKITETFDPEKENPEEVQRSGWQAILDNFKKYLQSLSKSNN